MEEFTDNGNDDYELTKYDLNELRKFDGDVEEHLRQLLQIIHRIDVRQAHAKQKDINVVDEYRKRVSVLVRFVSLNKMIPIFPV
jgi:hypothetical protein